jgi:ribonucleotide monophosphatase NagD (HAD superfamily)
VGTEFDEKLDLKKYRGRVIVIDIDGVLAAEDDYIPLSDRHTIYGAREVLKFLKQKGYILVLFTSRVKQQEKETVEWLIKKKIPFDDILFGKPRGILYIDDRGYRFRGWEKFLEDVEI